MNKLSHIAFNKPSFPVQTLRLIEESLKDGQTSGDGPFTRKAQQLLEQQLGVGKALLTTSCTDALELSAILLDIRPGDEVIMPSFTFVSTANAFVLRGAVPVFADIRRDTLNIDENLIEALITERTKAIVVVHYAGVACEMDRILEIADRKGLRVVEDNAHGIYGKYNGKALGSFGDLATQSFHETKNINCGEGGALLLNDPLLVERAEVIREKGTNRSKFFRGQVDKYTWVDIGSSFLISDILAAVLYAQLSNFEQIQNERRAIWNRYNADLGAWSSKNGIRLPIVPEHCEHSSHLFYLLMPSLQSRTRFIEQLKSREISAVFHYLPLHLSPMGRTCQPNPSDCPVTEEISERLVRLPIYSGLEDAQVQRIIDAAQEFSI